MANTKILLVNDTDHVQLSRLVIEAAWRVGNGMADTLHELFVDDGELIVGQTNLRGRQAIRNWGSQLVEARTYRCIRHVCETCALWPAVPTRLTARRL